MHTYFMGKFHTGRVVLKEITHFVPILLSFCGADANVFKNSWHYRANQVSMRLSNSPFRYNIANVLIDTEFNKYKF